MIQRCRKVCCKEITSELGALQWQRQESATGSSESDRPCWRVRGPGEGGAACTPGEEERPVRLEEREWEWDETRPRGGQGRTRDVRQLRVRSVASLVGSCFFHAPGSHQRDLSKAVT